MVDCVKAVSDKETQVKIHANVDASVNGPLEIAL